MTSRKFNPVKKDRLFYNQFEYCIGFYLEEASCLRILDHAQIDDLIDRRRRWQEIAQQRWINGRQNHSTILSRRWKPITEKNVADLHAVADVLLTSTCEYKLVVTVNQAHVYTNNVALIDDLDSMPQLTYKTFSQACITRPKNTIQLKNPKHRLRSYFHVRKLSGDQKDCLMDFLHNQKGNVRLSAALDRWFDTPFNRTQDYFFVEHDSLTWLTMLNLVQPGIVRKTMHIIPAK